MNKEELYGLALGLASVTVFSGALEKAPLSGLIKYLACDGDQIEKTTLYAEFLRSFSSYGFDFSAALCDAVYTDENEYIKRAASGRPVSDALRENACRDLKFFTHLTGVMPGALAGSAGEGADLPRFDSPYVDLCEGYADRVKNVKKYGYGLFSTARMFRIEGRNTVAVRSADTVTEDGLFGYEEERKKLSDNVEALLEGRPTSNTLLYGDAGTGKSSAVKACVNKYADRGLRLIELRKNQLLLLPAVTDRLRGDPLKFIIYIDDLSFTKNDDSFGMLKAALEGSSSASAENVMICATSNRRHIVKESFSDREGDDVHRNDTMQELMSLSDRFGLRIYFEKPTKELYLYIVRKLLEKYGIAPDGQTDKQAEAFALSKGGRSPRTAEQFVKLLSAKRTGEKNE